MPIRPSPSRCWSGLLLCLAVAACTPPPVFKPITPPLDITPEAVARMPERYHAGKVIWGGRIIEVRNRDTASELVILAYPLDAGQRPRPKEGSFGPFVAVLPGYVESFDYPKGRFVSVIGSIDGARLERVDEHDDIHPLVHADSVHLWLPGFENSGPQFHFGIGISGAIR